jgi:hypothetical protein
MTIDSSTMLKEACFVKGRELCGKNLQPGVQRFVGVGKPSPLPMQWIMSSGCLLVFN